MGEKGMVSRVLAPKHGGFLTFGALSADKASAPGQPLLTELKGLYGLPQQSASTQASHMPISHDEIISTPISDPLLGKCASASVIIEREQGAWKSQQEASYSVQLSRHP